MSLTTPAARQVSPLSRALRKHQLDGVPQYAVAAAAGVSPTYLSLIASGKMYPATDTAGRIAAALGEDVEQLFPTDH